MTFEVRDWLPHGFVLSDDVRRWLSKTVEDWSRRWLPCPALGVTDLTIIGRLHISSNVGGWQILCPSVALEFLPTMRTLLQSCALGMKIDGINLTVTDRLLIDEFTNRLTFDLADTIYRSMALYGAPGGVQKDLFIGFDESETLVATIADSLGGVLSIAIPLQDIVRCLKSGLSRSYPQPLELGPVTGAFDLLRVDAEAIIDCGRLAVSDIGGLQPGDVLVLEAFIEDGVELRAEKIDAVFGRGRLCDLDGSLALTLHSVEA